MGSKFYLVRWSRLVLIASLVLLVGVLSPRVITGQSAPRLEATVSRSINLPPLDPTLAPGNTFDQAVADAILDKTQSSNDWYKVPSWLPGIWHSDESRIALHRDEKSGLEERLDKVITWPASAHYGDCADKSGQVWQRHRSGWTEVENGGIVVHTLTMWRSNITDTGKEFLYQDHNIALSVDKKTNVITDCFRAIQETRLNPLSKGVVRMLEIERGFDWQGNPEFTQEIVRDLNRTGAVTDLNWKAADKIQMNSLFVHYLKEHKMKDLIPKK